MSFPACCGPTRDATCSLRHLINNKAFLRTVPLDLDKPLAVGCCKCWVEAKFLFSHPEKPEDRKHKPGPILIDVEPLRCETPESIKLPHSHKRSAYSKAQD